MGIIKKPWRNYENWVSYTEEQEKSLLNLVNKLCEDFDIKKDCVGNNVYNKRSNYSQELTDVSPAFKMELLK